RGAERIPYGQLAVVMPQAPWDQLVPDLDHWLRAAASPNARAGTAAEQNSFPRRPLFGTASTNRPGYPFGRHNLAGANGELVVASFGVVTLLRKTSPKALPLASSDQILDQG